MSVDTKTAIVLDKSLESKLQINFNVTLHALACRYASLDIADVMGTHLQNVTSNIIKTRIDRDGRVLGRAAKDAKKLVYAEPRGAPEHVPQVSPEDRMLDQDEMKELLSKAVIRIKECFACVAFWAWGISNSFPHPPSSCFFQSVLGWCT